MSYNIGIGCIVRYKDCPIVELVKKLGGDRDWFVEKDFFDGYVRLRAVDDPKLGGQIVRSDWLQPENPMM